MHNFRKRTESKDFFKNKNMMSKRTLLVLVFLSLYIYDSMSSFVEETGLG